MTSGPADGAARPSVSARLPDFPWDRLHAYAATARAHPDGIVDLSIGTPVDATPEVARRVLAEAADSPGYPTTLGIEPARQACLDWLARRHGVTGLGLDQVLPAIGSKEIVSTVAMHLGVGPGDLVVYPELAYPTYEVGAALVGADTVAADPIDAPTAFEERTPALLWLNSPSNPTGRVLGVEHLRAVVEWCRERGTVLVSDECYVECGWEAEPVSVLHPEVCGGSHEGLLALHSLSKRSNLAGYRCGFVAGDRALIGELLAVRKNLGMLMPGPMQRVMAAVLDDDEHVEEQRTRYARRRALLRGGLESAGFRIDHSEASLYLWATRDGDCWDEVAALTELGILVAPGAFYGAAGSQHVRVAFTATDERIDAAVARLTR